MKTSQEIVEHSARHMLKQGRPCLDDNGDCVNVNENGEQCGIACHIPKENFRLFGGLLDNKGQGGTFWYSLRKFGLIEDSYELLAQIRTIHDSHNVSEWKAEFELLCEELNLDPSFLKDL